MFEAIGLPATIETAIACLPTGGTAVLVGMTPFGARASFEPFPFVDGGRRILGSNYGSADPALDFPRYAALHLAGRLPAERLVTSRIGLDGIEDAFAAMRRGEGVRSIDPLLTPDPPLVTPSVRGRPRAPAVRAPRWAAATAGP